MKENNLNEVIILKKVYFNQICTYNFKIFSIKKEKKIPLKSLIICMIFLSIYIYEIAKSQNDM